MKDCRFYGNVVFGFLTIVALTGCGSGTNHQGSSSALDDVTNGVYCRANILNGAINGYGPASTTTGAWLDDGYLTTLGVCRQQILSGSYGVYCRRNSGENSQYYSPASTATGAWLDNGDCTDLSTCMLQVSHASSGVYCRRNVGENSPYYGPANTATGAWLDDSPATSLDVCMQQIY